MIMIFENHNNSIFHIFIIYFDFLFWTDKYFSAEVSERNQPNSMRYFLV